MSRFTYLGLSVVVLAFLAALCVPVLRTLPRRPLWWTAAALLAMTAVFDAAIVGFGLTTYDDALVLGLKVGPSPIEDFAYTVAAIMIVPTLWTVLGRRRRGGDRADRVEGGQDAPRTDEGA
jgi:lycopene cyclase domain-containing protein